MIFIFLLAQCLFLLIKKIVIDFIGYFSGVFFLVKYELVKEYVNFETVRTGGP